MKNRLVLITYSYPYGTGETYIEAEIGQLSAAFDEILIVVSNSGGKARILPDNCKVLHFGVSNSLGVNLRLLCRVMWDCCFMIRRIREELGVVKNQYHKKITAVILRQIVHDFTKGYQFYRFLCRHTDCCGSIYYSYWFDNKALGLAMLRDREKCITAVSRIHRWDLYFEPHSKGYISFQRYKCENLSGLFFIADQGREYFRRLVAPRTENLFLSRLGTRYPIRSCSTAGSRYLLVSCSRLVTMKRVSLIIESLSRLKGVELDWYHLGGGELETVLKKKAAMLLDGSPNVNYFFCGQMSNDQIHDFYASHRVDLCLNVSDSEGLPVSLMEAISYGIPIMATDVGGTAEICNSHTGVLLDKNISADGLAREISLYFQRPYPERERLRESSFEYWQKNFYAEKNYRRFIDMIKSFVESNES